MADGGALMHTLYTLVLVGGAVYFGWQTVAALLVGDAGRTSAGLAMSVLAVWAVFVNVHTIDDGGRR